MLDMPKIKVRLEAGKIRSVEDIPPDVRVEVIDYDVQDREGLQLSSDENGKPCDIREYHAPE